jgi:hypothetical protein
MPDFPTTTIETSSALDICQGFALIPALGTARAAVQGSNVQRDLFSVVNYTVIATRINLNLRWSYFVGVCGPAYAYSTHVSGSTDGANASFNFGGKYGANGGNLDGVAGGVQFGVELAFTFGFRAEQLLPRVTCYSTWDCRTEWYWGELLSAAQEVRLNLISLIFSVIVGVAATKGVNAESPVPPKASPVGPLGISLSQTVFGGLRNNGEATVNPNIQVPINLADYIPVVGQINGALVRFAGGLSLGPVIGIGFPVTVRPTQIWVNTQGYSNFTRSNGQTVGTRAWDAAWHPNQVVIQMTHSVGVDLRVGVYAQLTLLKVFSVGITLVWGIGELFSSFTGVDLAFAQYATYVANTTGAVNNNLGAMPDAPNSRSTAQAAPAKKTRVVFHKPKPESVIGVGA